MWGCARFLQGSEAQKTLKEAGFSSVSLSISGSEDAKTTLVVASDPLPGAWALPDDPISISAVSVVQVPNILDLGPVEASAELLHAGLVPDPYVREWGWGTDGNPRVIMTEPRPGETVSVGDIVHVTYNEEIPPERIEEVPSGQGRERKGSTAAGYAVGTVELMERLAALA